MSGQVTLFDVLTNPALMTQGGLGKLIQSELIVKVDSSTLFLRFIFHKIMVYILFLYEINLFFCIFFIGNRPNIFVLLTIIMIYKTQA